MNWLDNTTNQSSKFRTTNWVEINDETQGTYDTSSNKFKTTVLRSDLCDYSDSYILASGTIKITGAGDDDNARKIDGRNKGVISKNWAPFTNCISCINNIQINKAEYVVLWYQCMI